MIILLCLNLIMILANLMMVRLVYKLLIDANGYYKNLLKKEDR